MNNKIITIALAITSSAATAGVVDMKFTGKGAGSNIQIQIGESNPFNVFAGELNHEITNATGSDSFLNGSRITFCADVSEHVSSQFTQYQVTDLQNIPLTASNPNPMTAVQANAIRALYSQTATTLMAGNLSNTFGTAMQITIWEIVNDFDGTAASINLQTGTIKFAGTNGDPMDIEIVNQIENLKTQMMIGINLDQTGPDNVIGLASSGKQDQLVFVPTPGAISLLAAGSLLISRRRRN